jgi:hypothetical protein
MQDALCTKAPILMLGAGQDLALAKAGLVT